MFDHAEYRKILATLRETMKAKEYTYKRLARELQISEITVKRIFSGHTCSLERIFSICEILNVSFLDIATLAKEDEEIDYFLSPLQEKFFAEKPAYFALFKELCRKIDPKQVADSWALNSAQFYKVLRDLEKLDLLEVLPENKFRIKAKGNIRMSHRGPLAKKVLRPQINEFLDHIDRTLENDDVCMHSAEVELAIAHIPEFVEEIHELGAKYRARAYRDQNLLPTKKLKSVRWLFAFAPYQTNWHHFKI